MLNNVTNSRMQKAMESSNRRRKNSKKAGCSLAQLSTSLSQWLGDIRVMGINIMMAALETDVKDGFSQFYRDDNGTELQIPMVYAPKKNHIYRDFSLFRERGIITKGVLKPLIFPVMKMTDKYNNSIVVGVDKLGHFFAQGKEYHMLIKKHLGRTSGSTL